MAPIPVPKPPKKAYNPRRPAGTLLQNQLLHLEWAVRPAAERMPAYFEKIKKAKSEAEAARRIEKLTQELKRQAESPARHDPGVCAEAEAPASKGEERKRRSRSRRRGAAA